MKLVIAHVLNRSMSPPESEWIQEPRHELDVDPSIGVAVVPRHPERRRQRVGV